MDVMGEVQQLRGQGLSDHVILDELSKKGVDMAQVHSAIQQLDVPAPMLDTAPVAPGFSGGNGFSSAPVAVNRPGSDESNLYERIEQIAESMIDEKWDELIGEVKKIIEWKEQVEEKQHKMAGELAKLKEDFKTLHGGVLGKLEEYDHRMQDVGTELNAVGKVFKDVVPVFVENVKELKGVVENSRKEK